MATELLRLVTCGSVDDGKSTLIGRLLYDSKLIFDDQLSAVERDSRKHGTLGEEPDLALLVDGLEAEREQGITIDVAYRFFTTPRRAFIVADTEPTSLSRRFVPSPLPYGSPFPAAWTAFSAPEVPSLLWMITLTSAFGVSCAFASSRGSR